MTPRLRLYGGITWDIGGRSTVVGGRTRLKILLALAESQGSTVSTTSLIDRFWDEPPRSGTNAVERHISSLRADLVQLGAASPHGLISHVSGGYRLNSSVPTDLSDPSRAEWWLEPLVGARWEPHVGLRRHLEQTALSELGAWLAETSIKQTPLFQRRLTTLMQHTSDADAVSDAVLEVTSALRYTTHATSIAAVLHSFSDRVSPEVSRRIELLLPASSSSNNREPDDDSRETTRQVIGLWASGRTHEALDLLETVHLPDADAQRRISRALVWHSPDDPGVRHMLELVPEDNVVDNVQSERTLVSLDADTLNLMPDGHAVSQAEIDSATEPSMRLRSLRTEFMRRLAAPTHARDDELADQIGDLDLPDAEVEAARFRFINALRTGRWADASQLLDDYANRVAKVWRGLGDDFAPMARASLQRSLDPDCAAQFRDEGLRYGRFSADPALLDVNECVRRLILNHVGEPLSDVMFYSSIRVLQRPEGRAIRMLRNMNSGRPVREESHALAASLPTIERNKQFALVPIAVGRVAEALSDSILARTAVDALEPWSGQVLGVWPVDLVLGWTDDWISRFEQV